MQWQHEHGEHGAPGHAWVPLTLRRTNSAVTHVVDILGIRRMFVVVKGWSGVAPQCIPRDATWRHTTSRMF